MDILVCIKEVPVQSTVTIDPETGKLDREKAEAQINPVDQHALQAAIDLKKAAKDATITVVTMGPESAKESLRACIAQGADKGYLISDAAYTKADTLATGYTLAKAAEHLGKFDVVLCGTQTLDGDTGQVGPELAERLDLAQVTYVTGMEYEDDHLKVKRLNGNHIETLEVSLPALLTITKEANEIGKPNIKSKMAAKKATFEDLTPDVIGAEADKIGEKGSPTEVVEIYAPEELEKGVLIQEATAEESVKKLVDILVEKKLIG